MRIIYLLRHCETEQSPQKRCIGTTDILLNENGLNHAKRLKSYFEDVKLTRIFCSSALRAVKTAEIISNGKTPITRLSELCEINMGDWDGMYFNDIKSKYPDEYRRRGLEIATFVPPHGECFADCQKRALNALKSISENTAGNIAVVAHAGFNRALICGLCHIDLQELFTIPQPFGYITILSEENGVCRVRKAGFKPDEDD